MNNKSRLSLLVVQILIVSLMTALFGRLFYLQVAAGPKYREAALSIQSRDVVAPATRGLIVDGYGVPLAMNKAGLAITIDRIAIDKLEDKGVGVMKRLAALLNLKYEDIYQNTRLCGELPKGEKAGCWQGSRYQPIPITKSADLTPARPETISKDKVLLGLVRVVVFVGVAGAVAPGAAAPVATGSLKLEYLSDSVGFATVGLP